MAHKEDRQLIRQKIKEYIKILKKNHIPLWRVYLYGSYVKGTYKKDSDVDLAIFWDKDDIDGFDEDVQLLKLGRNIDLLIEPHSFAKSDFDETNPYIKEILETGERII